MWPGKKKSFLRPRCEIAVNNCHQDLSKKNQNCSSIEFRDHSITIRDGVILAINDFAGIRRTGQDFSWKYINALCAFIR